MSPTEGVTLRNQEGLALEAAVDAPDEPGAGLVLCHPHPKMGGTMNAPLLEALRDDLVARGWGVLRFNFRGIGGSEGEASTGIEEVADAGAALAEARRRWQGLPVAIAGWSFGAAVAVRAAADDRELVACVAIAPSIKAKPDITAGLPEPDEIHLPMPSIIVVGANDTVISPEDCEEWARAQGIRIVTMPGANHFFWGKYDDLVEAVGDFLDAQLT